MEKKALSKQELQWQAEEDARTLKRYAEIQLDKNRLNLAHEVLEKEAQQISSALESTSTKGII